MQFFFYGKNIPCFFNKETPFSFLGAY